MFVMVSFNLLYMHDWALLFASLKFVFHRKLNRALLKKYYRI
jgi:hypothetical protein